MASYEVSIRRYEGGWHVKVCGAFLVSSEWTLTKFGARRAARRIIRRWENDARNEENKIVETWEM